MSTRGLLIGFFGAVVCALAVAPEARAATVNVNLYPTQTIFFPRVVVINVGDTVTWNYPQTGGLAHNVVSDDGTTFTSGIPAAGGVAPWPYSFVFTNAGVFPYHCEPHQSLGMTGIVIVGSATRVARAGNEIAYEIGAWDFEGADSTTTTDLGAEPMTRTITAGTADLRAGVQLPSGAQITGLELAACDGSSFTMTATLLECIDPPGAAPLGLCNTVASVSSSGTVATPVCGFFGTAAGAVTWSNVDNFGYTYVVRVTSTGTTSLLRLRGVRVYYKKTISPPPLTATFADVPTIHSQFQFIEALVAAGITSGCGSGNYCPTNSVTRGQMAVFLCRLAGLNWPN